MSDQLEFRVAIREAIIEEMERDEAVVFFGEDIAAEQGGVFAVTPGIQERFGAERVFDTPISELAITGAAFGAAVTGLRPIIEIMFGDFMGLAMDSLVNQSAKYWYLSNERRSVPLVVRSAVGGGGRFGAIHSQTHATWFQGVPGLKIAFPSSPAEAKGLLKAAIRDDNPVIFLEHKRLYSVKAPTHPTHPGPEHEDAVIPLGRAHIARAGTDITIASSGKGVPDALSAAEQLAQQSGVRGRGARPPHPAATRPPSRPRVGGPHQPPAGRRGGPRDRRLGLGAARTGRRARPARPRRRVAADHRRVADSLQPDARGRVHPGPRGDHLGRARTRRHRPGPLRPAMPEVVMPRLSDSMEEGTIVRWLKQDGEQVAQGEPLAEVETDKATVTFEADADGILRILAGEGQTVPIGGLIARIGEAAESPPPPAREENGRVKASPLARRIARETGVDLSQLAGTGPGGRIVKADVSAAARAHAGAISLGTISLGTISPGAISPGTISPGTISPRGPARPRQQGSGHDPAAQPHAGPDRSANGGVQGDDPRFHPARRGRHGAGGGLA